MKKWDEIAFFKMPKRAVRLGLGFMTILFVAGMATPSFGQCNVNTLRASDGAGSDFFGKSVSVNGDLAIVGAEFDDDLGVSSGSAYVYRFDPDTSEWIEEFKLLASDGMANDRFGGSVSVCGDLAVVGATGGFSSILPGSAYIFRYDPDTSGWIEEARLLASDGAAEDLFGESVSVSGNIVVVGARYDDDNGSNSGSAYVFRYDSQVWNEEAKLLASDGMWSDFFGKSVSVHDHVIAVGAYLSPIIPFSNIRVGAAYIYRYDPDTSDWSEEAKLRASDGEDLDIFGISVSVHEDVAIVGAWLDDDNGEDSGSSYIFRYDPDTSGWYEEAKLLASDGEADDAFGRSVSIWEDMAVISVNRADDGGIVHGLAYIYRYNPDTSGWIEQTKLVTRDDEVHHTFGRSVSVWGDRVIIGQGASLTGAIIAGSAHIFDLENLPPSCPQVVLLSLWPPNHQYETIDLSVLAGVHDPNGGELTITITSITQDEPINAIGDGNTSCDAVIVSDGIARVRRERAANGDGRVYVINYIAQDTCGSTCTGILRVEIPRNESTPAVDSGQLIDATMCSSSADLNGDKIVNVSDLLILLSTYGQSGPAENRNLPDGDVDQDGDVDISDLLMLLVEWG